MPALGPIFRILLAAALIACLPSHAREGKRDFYDFSLREAVHSVPVAAAGANIVVTSFRPGGDGPFPWLVLSHGTATTLEANRAIGRYRPLNPVREWVKRGYAVLVPVRRGYGASGGAKLGDDYGGCGHPDFRRAEPAHQNFPITQLLQPVFRRKFWRINENKIRLAGQNLEAEPGQFTRQPFTRRFDFFEVFAVVF